MKAELMNSEGDVEIDIDENSKRKKRKKNKQEEGSGVNSTNGNINVEEAIVNSRKRSLSSNVNQVKKKRGRIDNGDIPLKSDTDHLLIDENKQNDEFCIAEEEKEKKKTVNQGRQLNGKNLRISFNSANGLDTLRTFVKICNENQEQDLASEYLLAGGNVLEILRLLDIGETKSTANTTVIFSAISILLVKILAQYPQYQTSAVEACRHLINSHLSHIHSMLSTQSNAKQRKVALKLLAAIVSLGGNLPRDMLAQFTLQSQTLEYLVQHTKPNEKQSVRTCFIHFVLAFLVEGKVPIIRALLDKRGILSSIFPGLIYDSKDIICLVLTTIKTYILENTGINKTTKLYVFSTSVVQNLISLYNWKGPTNWPKAKTPVNTSSPQYLAEKEVVVDVVHNFLIVLLTSHRHGIIFHDHTLGTSRTKHNQLVNTVLQSLEKPWEHEMPSDLVVKILTACPDLIKSQLNIIEPYVEPRPSKKWVLLMRFLRKIIESLDADICLKTSSILNTNNFVSALASLIMPGMILKKAIIPSLNNDNLVARNEGILWLLSALNQIHKFLLATQKNTEFDFDVFKNYLTEYTVKNVPNLDILLKVWNEAFSSGESKETDKIENENVLEPKIHEHINNVLNLLLMYETICPELLDAPLIFPSNTLLSTLNELDNVDVTELTTIKVKAIQFLLALDPAEFTPRKETFTDTLSYLVSLLYGDSSKTPSLAKTAIEALLNSTGLFENCNDQIDIWIHSFTLENENERETLTNWFISSIRKAVQHLDKYINNIIQVEETVNANYKGYHANTMTDIFNELLEKDNNVRAAETCNALYMQRSTAISPLLYYVLHKLKKNPHPAILSYMSNILLHTLHHQVRPECLLYLVKDLNELPVQKYLLSWSENNSPIRIKKSVSPRSIIYKFSFALLSNEKVPLEELFTGNIPVNLSYDNEDITIAHSLSAYEVTCLLKMTLFYLTQYATRGTLNEIQNHNCKWVLVSLLYIAKKLEMEESFIVPKCIKSIFSHPVMLQYFAAFSQKEDFVKNSITCTIFDICTVAIHLCDKPYNVSQFVPHFKAKFLSQLNRMIDKRQRSDKVKNFEITIFFLQLFELTSQETVYLLKKIVSLESDFFVTKDKSSLTIYGHVVPKLLDIVCSKRVKSDRATVSGLDTNFVSILCAHLLHTKSNVNLNVDKWENALQQYLSNFLYNIAGINTSIFISLLSKKISYTTVNLTSLLTNKCNKFISTFTNYVMKSELLKEDSIVFPILANNSMYNWSSDFLQKINDYYQPQIISYLNEPGSIKWIEPNVTAVCLLINNNFDITACSEICSTILQSGDKLELVSVEYVQILQSVYNKYVTLNVGDETLIAHLIQVLLHITTLTLKKESKNIEKLNVLCKGIEDAVHKLRENKKDTVLESLNTNHSWPQFTRFSLKLGLKETKANTPLSPILKILTLLCDVAYKENSNNEYVKTLFEMTTSHSEFVNIMLGSSSIKRSLVELLWIFIRKNNSVMALPHIPLYLAAYGATLSETDQLILLILQYYERNNINVHDYRPYLWGNAAAIHYSVKDKTNVALWMQPTTTQVLNLLEKEIVSNTIKNFPVHRNLENHELSEVNDVYDPAFYLPLFCFLLSENNIVSCNKFAVSGGLALVLTACGSSQSDTRMAAYTVISRFYAHLEASNSKAKLLWMRLIDALRNGIILLESELNNTQLSCIVSTFLAQTCLIATQPLNPLYSTLQSFLMAKPALDVKTIPELLQLFHNSDVEYKAHRYWILEIIRDGMKTERDMEVAFKCVLFKMLLSFYLCSLSDNNSKRLILEVIYAASKIPKASVFLIHGHGLLPWIQQISNDSRTNATSFVGLIIKIMSNLLIALPDTRKEAPYRFLLLNIALCLMPRLPKNITLNLFALYTTVLHKLFTSKHTKISIMKETVQALLDFSKGILDNIDKYEDMLIYNCEHLDRIEELKGDNEVDRIRNNLKLIVSMWCNQNRASLSLV